MNRFHRNLYDVLKPHDYSIIIIVGNRCAIYPSKSAGKNSPSEAYQQQYNGFKI